MEEIHNLLEYSTLKIVQNNNAFKFSLDSILLARFASVTYRTKKILDIGTGNAPIPLILSTKTQAHITGIEIQKESFVLAEKSVKLNHLEDKITILNTDIHQFYKQSESDQYDLIVCNPPYFRYQEDSITNKTESKTVARHETNLNVGDICKIAKKLLKNNGKLAIVHRTERLIDIISSMKENNIEPKKICFVYPYKGKESNLLLIEGSKNGKVGVHILDPLYVYDEERQYTEEIKQYFK
ncbi:MAG: tRNA1(Val) (adenine(37)-N6)-methyltransferase [Bacilli bacterium]|nr:tRNA1(Val) (adenine(37)-N6)-methyltransferase [Bacilli bacterium]